MRKYLLGAIAACVLLTAPGTAWAQSTTPVAPTTGLEKAAPYVQPSVVYLDLEWTGWVYDKTNHGYFNNNKPFTIGSYCTGFAVTPDGYIATAGHCVDPVEQGFNFKLAAAKWAIKTHYYQTTPSLSTAVLDFGDNWRIEGADKTAGGAYSKSPDLKITAAWSTSVSGETSADTLPAKVVQYEPFDQGDVAVVKIDATDMTPLLSADVTTLDVGTPIVSIGYAQDVGAVTDATVSDPSFKSGDVSSLRTVGNGIAQVYEVSSTIGHGMSGGPTVNFEGEVVGINSFGANEDFNFNFIQPVSNLDTLLADAGVTPELGDVGTAYKAGLDAYFAGDKATATAQFQQVLALQPDHALATEYLQKAQAIPDPVEPEKQPMAAIYALVGLLLIVIVGGAVYFIRDRSAKKNQSPPQHLSPAA